MILLLIGVGIVGVGLGILLGRLFFRPQLPEVEAVEFPLLLSETPETNRFQIVVGNHVTLDTSDGTLVNAEINKNRQLRVPFVYYVDGRVKWKEVLDKHQQKLVKI